MTGVLRGERLRITHLFPDRLNLYGDRGNVQTLARRAHWRGARVELESITTLEPPREIRTDIIFIGGGPDRQQVAVAAALERIAEPLLQAVADGAALVAICGGFQNLGHGYRSALAGDLRGVSLFDATSAAPDGARRMVGRVVAELAADSPVAMAGAASAAAAGFAGEERTLVGFENHAGRTFLGDGQEPLGRVGPGHGNNGVDGHEGLLAMPDSGGLKGLRLGSYLHGPLLPANPHIADLVIACAIGAQTVSDLGALADDAEWAAHAAASHRPTSSRPGKGSPAVTPFGRQETPAGRSRRSG
jgi:CobQ-like glutamine amidotransferase family enzyme